MAARINRMHSEQVRLKIQASVIIQRLQSHFNGTLELTPSQLRSAEILLDRSVPKLSQIQHTGDKDNPVQIEKVERVILDAHAPA